MPRDFRTWVTQAGLTALGVGLGLALGWLAIRGTDWSSVRRELSEFPFALLLLALAILLASFYLRALRWRLLWTDHKVTAFRLMLIETAALGLNNVSPVRAMDEPLEFGILRFRDRLPGGTIVATMMMSRIQDLAFTLLFVVLAVVSLPQLLRFGPAIALTGLYFIAWLAMLLNLGRIVRRFPRLKRLPGMQNFEQALRAIQVDRRRMASSFALTCAYWLLLAPIGWLIAIGVGMDVAFHQVLFVVLGSIFFSTAVPGLPGAVGTFEFAIVSLLGLFEVPREPALTFGIILHAVLFLPSTFFTVVVLPREGLATFPALREMIRKGRETRE